MIGHGSHLVLFFFPWRQYGQDQGNRLQGMTPEDIAYARKHLDEDLMKALHYKHPGDA